MDEVQRLSAEIERLHQFFEDWYAGVGDHLMEEFADSLDDAFYIVSPRGDVLDRGALLGWSTASAAMVASKSGSGTWI